MTRPHRFFAVMLAAAVASNVTGQDFFRDNKWLQIPFAWGVSTEDPSWETIEGWIVAPPNRGQAYSRIKCVLDSGSEDEVQLPFHRVGSIQRVSQGVYIVSGVEYTSWAPRSLQGHLAIVNSSIDVAGNPDISVQQSVPVPLDPFGLEYNPNDGVIYVWDYWTGVFWEAAWQPGSALPTGWSLIVPDASVTDLMANRHWCMSGVYDSFGGMINDEGGVVIIDHLRAHRWRLEKGLGGILSATQLNWQDDDPYIDIESPHTVGGLSAFALTLRNSANPTTVSVIDPSGVQIASALLNPDSPTSIGPLPMFNVDPGANYKLHFNHQSLDPMHIQTSVRHGAFSGTQAFGFGQGFAALVGSIVPPEVGVGAAFHRDGSISGNASCSLNIAFRLPDGNGGYIDPVTGGILNPSASVYFDVSLSEFRSVISHAINIPDDPALDGEVVLMQYVGIAAGGATAHSDVFGARITTVQALSRSSGGAHTSSARQALLESNGGQVDRAYWREFLRLHRRNGR